MSTPQAPGADAGAGPGAEPAQPIAQTPAPAPAPASASAPEPASAPAPSQPSKPDTPAEAAKPAAAAPKAKAAEAAAPAATPAPAATDAPAAGGDAPAKKLTGAELKALKQAEKAKRRAAVIAAKEASSGGAAAPGAAAAASAASGGGSAGGQSKAGKQKGKHDDASGGPRPSGGCGEGGKISGPVARHSGPPTAASAAADAAAAAAAAAANLEKDPRSGIPESFSHLPMAKRCTLSQAHKDVHPAVLAVGQQMASFALYDNMARLEATLLAFKKVIQSYKTPPGNAFSRHFMSHVLNPQIEYLIECRPMCFAMGNAIRLLKARVSQLDLDTDDADAIADLCDTIDTFIQERIVAATVGIAHEAASMIHDGDVVLTYGGPRLVRAALSKAWDLGMRFDLIVVHDASSPEAGKDLAKLFQQRRNERHAENEDTDNSDDNSDDDDDDDDDAYVTYCPSLDGIDSHVARATTVFLGVEAVFANGALLAPVGTCDVAMAASAQGCAVIALSETVNFDGDRVATDALVYNEIDPDRCDAGEFRLLFDTTQASLVSMLICEYEEASGKVPSHATYQVMRTREDPN